MFLWNFLWNIFWECHFGTFLRNVSILPRHIPKTHSSVRFPNDIPKRYSTKNSILTFYSLEIFLRIIPSHHDSFIMRKENRTEQNRIEQKSFYIKWCLKASVADSFINLQKSIYHWSVSCHSPNFLPSKTKFSSAFFLIIVRTCDVPKSPITA